MGEKQGQAPINDEAKKRSWNLPGLGGVFNYVNFHVYHYAGNNPVKLIDPGEKWTLSLGLSGRAAFGGGVHGSAGIAFGYSKEAGFSFGVYATGGVNAGSATAGAGGTGSFTKNAQSVRDLNGPSTSIGGSATIIGIDIATKGKTIVDPDPASGVSITIQTPALEIHGSVIDYTVTASTSVPEIIEGMKEIKQGFKEWVIDKIRKTIPQW